MIGDYAVLLFFAVVNLAALFYQRAFSIGTAAYLASLILLYASFTFLYGFLYEVFLFWCDGLKPVATLLYCFTSTYCVIMEKRIVLLPLIFINMFLCHAVIAHTTGYTANMTFSMFSEPYDERVLNTISDTAGIAMVFMCIGIPVFLLIKLLLYVNARMSQNRYANVIRHSWNSAMQNLLPAAPARFVCVLRRKGVTGTLQEKWEF